MVKVQNLPAIQANHWNFVSLQEIQGLGRDPFRPALLLD
jgi:hypothetical protein